MCLASQVRVDTAEGVVAPRLEISITILTPDGAIVGYYVCVGVFNMKGARAVSTFHFQYALGKELLLCPVHMRRTSLIVHRLKWLDRKSPGILTELH